MYNKLFTKILDSSIWLEPHPTRIVWITLIAAMDEDGYAHFSSIRNLANRAMVTVEEAEAAVRTLEGPDPDSNNEANDGRRIERVPGGWMVLNAEAHRDMVTRAVRRERTRERVAKFRAKRACNADVTQSVSVSDSVSDPLPTEEVGANAPPAPKPKRATRIPDGWEPTPDLIEYAKKNLPNVDVDKLREAFTDYWAAAAGERARKADWNATWRTWVRRSSDNYPMEAKRPEFTSGQIRYDANGRVIHA